MAWYSVREDKEGDRRRQCEDGDAVDQDDEFIFIHVNIIPRATVNATNADPSKQYFRKKYYGTPGGLEISRQKNSRIPRHINIDMKRFLQYLSESAFDIHSLDYDANHGESFRWAYTPKDQPGKFSIVTPSNGEAWTDWKPVSPEHSDMLRDKWNKHKEAGTLNDFVAPHKINQIEQHAV